MLTTQSWHVLSEGEVRQGSDFDSDVWRRERERGVGFHRRRVEMLTSAGLSLSDGVCTARGMCLSSGWPNTKTEVAWSSLAVVAMAHRGICLGYWVQGQTIISQRSSVSIMLLG